MQATFSLISTAHIALNKLLKSLPSPPTPPKIVSRRWCVLFLPTQLWERNRIIHLARLRETIGNSGPHTYATLESASLLYETEVLDFNVEVYLTFRANHQRRKTRVGAFIRDLQASTVHRIRRNHLPKEAYTLVQGVPTLKPEYLILEYLSLKDTERAFVGAESLFRKLCGDNKWKRKEVEEAALKLKRKLRALVLNKGYPYARKRILGRLDFIGPWSDSAAESRFKAQLFLRGFPTPVQQKLVVIDGRVFFVDAAWLKFGVFAEVDGDIKYQNDAAGKVRLAEKRRESFIRRVIPHVVRFSWKDLSEDAKFMSLSRFFPPGTMNVPRVL
ncbi:hypothetical protein NXS08_04915 [Gleimia sp. 6138-11-ORH1]|uniref:hypothetical protein n=1 Tax=Gleimia sp. 6138-11-ORH1 TaxID=2973937 RepID=UPI002169FF8C|nr:hypothetical protein [Gleimia sp. 6138-11-ORH1]MCS4484818.1 hypothetical protein [Gleimia sp. 6138-11-ORH1]